VKEGGRACPALSRPITGATSSWVCRDSRFRNQIQDAHVGKRTEFNPLRGEESDKYRWTSHRREVHKGYVFNFNALFLSTVVARPYVPMRYSLVRSGTLMAPRDRLLQVFSRREHAAE